MPYIKSGVIPAKSYAEDSCPVIPLFPMASKGKCRYCLFHVILSFPLPFPLVSPGVLGRFESGGGGVFVKLLPSDHSGYAPDGGRLGVIYNQKKTNLEAGVMGKL